VIKLMGMKWVGHIALMEEMENAHRILVGRPGGKRPAGKITHNETII
jgi:hypothetical protein